MREYLFAKGELRQALETSKQRIRKEIQGLPRDYVLGVSEADLCSHLVDKYTAEAPSIRRDEIAALEPVELDVDVSGDPRRAAFHGPAIIRGTRITFIVPFDGKGEFFDLAPGPFMTVHPHGRVEGQELHFVYETADHDANAVRQRFEQDMRVLEQTLRNTHALVDQYNGEIKALITTEVAQRRKKLMADAGLAAALGVPIRRRPGAAEALTPPVVRRRVRVQPPVAPPGRFVPEPTLVDAEYDYILEVIQRIALLMERSPGAFARLDEEHLRDNFLFHLNGHYEGEATGETFNAQGKTDILIRHEGKNIFIAECKFWRGQKSCAEALDQLLSYTTWRDTKTALLIFNRGRNHTDVLQKIDETIRSHPNFKRTLEKRGETHFRYVLHQPGDVNREIIVSVLAFNVPSPDDVDGTLTGKESPSP
jgi:hypothetical protein